MDSDAGSSNELDGSQQNSRRHGQPVVTTTSWQNLLKNRLGDILRGPCLIVKYFRTLSGVFGWRMIALIVLVYGVNQGFGEEFGFYAGNYYLKDELKLEVATAQAVSNVFSIPWTIKPLYGMISDTFPLQGYSRVPYIFMAGATGAAAWFLLGARAWGLWGAALLLTAASLSIASPDVMIDAAVAEASRDHPKHTADLQSLCWGTFAVGGLAASVGVGWLEDHWGPRFIFGLNTLTALAITYPAARNWLGEKRLPQTEWKPKWHQLSEQKNLFGLATFISLSAVILSCVIVKSSSPWISGLGGLGVAAACSAATHRALGRVHAWMGRVALYLFLASALQISASEAFFYWSTDYEGGPKFSPEFMGWTDIVAYLSMMAGVAAYNRYMSNWGYRRVFAMAQVALAAVGMLDFILVMRWNLAVGIPDTFFVLGEEALAPLFRRMLIMPMFVLASKVCPPGIEGTLFALLMSLMNFGGIVGKILGVGAVSILGVSKDNYSMLPMLVIVKSASRLIPILLIPLLVPDLTPADPVVDFSGWEEPRPGDGESGKRSDDFIIGASISPLSSRENISREEPIPQGTHYAALLEGEREEEEVSSNILQGPAAFPTGATAEEGEWGVVAAAAGLELVNRAGRAASRDATDAGFV